MSVDGWFCWDFNGYRPLSSGASVVCLVLLLLFHPNFLLPCSSINSEGLALLKFREKVVKDPLNTLSNWNAAQQGDFVHCSWFGVLCSHDGKVVALNLKDLCLQGTLTPELRNLPYIKSIILRNNSFSGIIPNDIVELKELEVLDLGYNNFSGAIPSNLRNHFSLSILLLDNNDLLDYSSAKLNQLHLVDESEPEDFIGRRLLQEVRGRRQNRRGRIRIDGDAIPSQPPSIASSPSPSPSPNPSPRSRFSPFFRAFPSLSPSPSPEFAPSPSPLGSSSPSPAPAPAVLPPSDPPSPPPAVSVPPASAQAARVPVSSSASNGNSKGKHHKVVIWASAVGASAFIIILVAAILICRSSKVVTVKPWATGLSGQLQKAFVSGVPKLKRVELEVACEDFSNIIGSLNDGIVYKGTLSSGVEIAVISSMVKSRDEWSRNLEAQFRKKIETLSRVNHKNFVNLIGYCEEEKPFTRMMVFEYAPNGTLFEHLHIKEAERLDWSMRLRIIMGMAYCLEHMHQLDPPVPHRDLQSGSIYLSEDYAAKISDFSFWNEGTGAKTRSPSLQLLETTLTDIESNVFNFGVVLFEIITGRMPFMDDNCSLADWVLDYLEKDYIPRELVDPTLTTFEGEQVQRLFHIIKHCMQPEPKERPRMSEVIARLRDITRMGPDAAIPKLSPLWWAELEVLSIEAN